MLHFVLLLFDTNIIIALRTRINIFLQKRTKNKVRIPAKPLKKALADVKLCFKANTVKHGKARKTRKRWLTKMLKRERLDQVMNMVTERNYISVADLAKSLQVSEMTIRRDLDELAKSGKLIRLHGGAQIISSQAGAEQSFQQKRGIHIPEKQEIAQIAASLVHDKETIYVGPGTTLEMMVAALKQEDLRIVTNSMPVFEAARKNPNNYELILAGGFYRPVSGTFCGALTNNELAAMNYDQAFVGVNGISDSALLTADIEEGQTQSTGLKNSQRRIIVADMYKFNHRDFYQFYSLYDIDELVTNSQVSADVLKYYQQYTSVRTNIEA